MRGNEKVRFGVPAARADCPEGQPRAPARSLPRATAPRDQAAPASSASPDDAAIDRLVTAVIVQQHDEWAVAERRYLPETLPG
jgi:hypothetical protein